MRKPKTALACPSCGSTRLWKAGYRYFPNGLKLQRWLCRECGHRFSKSLEETAKELNVTLKDSPVSPSFILDPANVQRIHVAALKKGLNESALAFRKDVEPHVSSPYPSDKEYLNTTFPYDKDRRNLMQELKPLTEPQLKTTLLDFAWHLKKQGRAETTIRTYVSALRKITSIGANLHDPESVKEALTTYKISNGVKKIIVNGYTAFLKFTEATWIAPTYEYKPPIPFIPTEEEIDQVIAGVGPKTSSLLQTLKETAMRIGEAAALEWTDINFKGRTISVNAPEKHGNPRILSVSTKLLDMLNQLPRNSTRVFGDATISHKNGNYFNQRRRLARKLGNPRLLRITFHTFRHWKASMEYHKTKDIMHVKQLLGHRSIQSTMIYITIENALFQNAPEDYVSKVAKTVEEAQALVDVGFEFVCSFDDEGKLFKKRK